MIFFCYSLTEKTKDHKNRLKKRSNGLTKFMLFEYYFRTNHFRIPNKTFFTTSIYLFLSYARHVYTKEYPSLKICENL